MNAVARDLTLGSSGGMAHALVSIKAVDEATVTAALRRSAANGKNVEDQLLADGKINRADILHANMHRGFSATVARLADLPDWNVILNEPGQLMGATVRDPNLALIAHEGDRTRRCFLLVSETTNRNQAATAVAKTLEHNYPVAGTLTATRELMDLLYAKWDSDNAGGKPGDDAQHESSDVQLEFETLASEAYRLKASDIHITGARGKGTVQLRIHGELEHHKDMTQERAHALCSAIYNTLVERGSTKEGFNPEKMQDGAIERKLPEGEVRFRYSGLPIAPSGFDVTLRIIPIGVRSRRLEMKELGYSDDQCETLERIFSMASGLILFAGTTGSGKSTTMANLLRKIAEERPGKKIRTVEEPVEYRIEGAQQTPVTRLNGDKSDFLIALRQIMRSDPDVIGVGEIRDGDTADLAIQAVRSGHMCVSTIHADGAPVCYDRLIGMGINRLDLAQVGLIAGLIYQKLLPVLCTKCKVPAVDFAERNKERAAGLLRRLSKRVDKLDEIFFRNPDGCESCSGRGVVGRTVCAEILRPTPKMLAAIAAGDSTRLWKEWRSTIDHDDPLSMRGRTAFEHAIMKMELGLVSPEAVESEFRFLDEPVFDGEDV